MKKTLLLAAALFSIAAQAEVITLDLSQPTEPEKFEFAENGMWKETYNDTAFAYFSTQKFNFSHLPSRNSWGGMSWEGFTVSQATQDGAGYGYYSNVAKGGLKGEGTPYIFAYYSEYWLISEDNKDMLSSNVILFDGEYYPREVYLNNALVAYNDVVNGASNGGYKFGDFATSKRTEDRFEVWIKGLDADYEETEEKVVYQLAYFAKDTSFVNTKWEKVDLSALGKVSGLSFTVVSTDQGTYGTNTSTYFALDGLSVSTTADEPLVPTFTAELPANEIAAINIYTIAGQLLGNVIDTPQNIIRQLPRGTYMLRSNDKVMKVVK